MFSVCDLVGHRIWIDTHMSKDPDWVFYSDNKPTDEDLMARLVADFPAFRPRWEEHLQYWKGEPAGRYLDIAEFVHFVVEDLYPNGKTDEIQRVFDLMEEFLIAGSQKAQELVVIGFLEGIQNIASWQPFPNEVFISFLRPKSREAWDELERVWAGKTSLMEVVKEELRGRR